LWGAGVGEVELQSMELDGFSRSWVERQG
jgi:hypothetical protein